MVEKMNAHVSVVQDVIEEGREVIIVAEMPGVKKEDIQIHASQCSLTISVDTMERNYHKELMLPIEIDPESALATYKNGVLLVRLKNWLTHNLSLGSFTVSFLT